MITKEAILKGSLKNVAAVLTITAFMLLAIVFFVKKYQFENQPKTAPQVREQVLISEPQTIEPILKTLKNK